MGNYVSKHTGAEIDNAVDKAHEHTNKALLDSIPTTGTSGYVLTKGAGNSTVWAAPRGGGSSINAQSGKSASYSLTKESASSVINVAFDVPFAAVPIVVVGLETLSTNYGGGYCSVAVIPNSVTEEGFQAKIYNASGTTRSIAFDWIAIGI